MATNPKISLRPDFCIIGAGAAGLSFAAGAVQMGADVVLLEHNKMGGDCLNAGCIPSKSLIAAAKIGHQLKAAAAFGWSIPSASVDFDQVKAHIQSVIATIAPNDSKERFEKLGAQVILEEGQFIDATSFETAHYRIRAKRFILATGSSPSIPPIPGLATTPYYTNETIFEIATLPKHLLIIGGGPIGIEMAQAFQRLGSQVTVISATKILMKDDPIVVAKLRAILLAEGIVIKENVSITGIKSQADTIIIDYIDEQKQTQQVTGSHVLVAAGRKANIATLNLAAAKIKFTPTGISVDKHLQTSNARVYALGDCTGGYQFTHVAGYHAGLAIRHSIFKFAPAVQTHALPWVTYTDPELAQVGLTENQLQQQQLPYKALHMSFADNDRAQTQKQTQGEIKVLVTPKGKILGATILGIQAGELIYPWVIAIQNKLTIAAITNSIAPYPTLNDINKRVAGSFYTDKIFNESMRKLVRLLMRLTR